jgi:hypothetical protein
LGVGSRSVALIAAPAPADAPNAPLISAADAVNKKAATQHGGSLALDIPTSFSASCLGSSVRPSASPRRDAADAAFRRLPSPSYTSDRP